jgi:methyl-accepting chemotaxis protein
LTQSQSHIRIFIIGVGAAAVLIGLLFSWLVGRSITRPLNGLTNVMTKLAAGDTSASIPATEAEDELGAMARTVIVFRDTMIERERLAAGEAATNREREQRTDAIGATITRFEMSVDQALGKVREAAGRLEVTSTQLHSAADQVSAESRAAEERVGVASGNVTAAAGAVEELAASISEIAGQANRSTEVATAPSGCAPHRPHHVGSEVAATRIGEVVGLIQAIAGQTNLLALNATVKPHAPAKPQGASRSWPPRSSRWPVRTAKATEEIAGEVGAIQSAVADAATPSSRSTPSSREISHIAGTVAVTVEEQNRAVASISEGVNRASSERTSAGVHEPPRRHLARRPHRRRRRQVARRHALARASLNGEVAASGGRPGPHSSRHSKNATRCAEHRLCSDAPVLEYWNLGRGIYPPTECDVGHSSPMQPCRSLTHISVSSPMMAGPASHIALSIHLMALFPFIIPVTALAASFLGAKGSPTRSPNSCSRPGRASCEPDCIESTAC